MLRLRDNSKAFVDLGTVLLIGIAFVAMVVVSYIVFELQTQLTPSAPAASDPAWYNRTYYQVKNITEGWDNAISLLLVAITVFILAVAIAALYVIRGRS